MKKALKTVALNEKKKTVGLPLSLIIEQVAATVDNLDRTPLPIDQLFEFVKETLATELDQLVPVANEESYQANRCQVTEWL